MRTPLSEALASGRTLLADGAMGTQLQAEGLPIGACGELWNVEKPEAVKRIQARYRDAGSDLVLTNTFGGTSLQLSRHGLQARAAEFNRAAARLAREVMGEDRWVLGDLGPFGGMLEPFGDADPDDVYASFLEQARALLEGGVDGLIVETQTAVDEMELGVKAALEAGAPVVIASMAFDHAEGKPPHTMTGVSPEQGAERMLAAGAHVIGFNCGTHLSPADYVDLARRLRAVAAGAARLIAQPNAGSPEMQAGRIVYRESPGKMAEWIERLLDEDVAILGGCCGTTPRHIELFRQALDRR